MMYCLLISNYLPEKLGRVRLLDGLAEGGGVRRREATLCQLDVGRDAHLVDVHARRRLIPASLNTDQMCNQEQQNQAWVCSKVGV